MSNLPAGWALTTIGTVCDIRTGKTPPTGNRENFSTDIPFFKPGDLGRADALDTSEYSISHIGAEVAGYLPKHTVLVSCIGNLGKVGILAVAGSCNQQINAILPSPKIEPRFILYWAKQLRPWLEENASATTISIVNKGRFEKAPLPLPPLDEQRRIVAMLDSLLRSSKAACEELDHIPKLVERYKKAVLAAAFRGEITAAWRTENNRPGPADWPTRTLGDLALDIRYGKAAKCHYEPKATPVLRIPNVAAGKIDIGDLKYGAFEASDIKKLSLERGDLLVVRSNGSLNLVGKVAIVDESVAGYLFAGYLIRLRLDEDKVLPTFVALAFEEPSIRSTVERFAKSTSGVNNINSEQLRSLEIPIPPLAEQHEIVVRVYARFLQIDSLLNETARAKALVERLDQAALGKAFRGELLAPRSTEAGRPEVIGESLTDARSV